MPVFWRRLTGQPLDRGVIRRIIGWWQAKIKETHFRRKTSKEPPPPIPAPPDTTLEEEVVIVNPLSSNLSLPLQCIGQECTTPSTMADSGPDESSEQVLIIISIITASIIIIITITIIGLILNICLCRTPARWQTMSYLSNETKTHLSRDRQGARWNISRCFGFIWISDFISKIYISYMNMNICDICVWYTLSQSRWHHHQKIVWWVFSFIQCTISVYFWSVRYSRKKCLQKMRSYIKCQKSLLVNIWCKKAQMF